MVWPASSILGSLTCHHPIYVYIYISSLSVGTWYECFLDCASLCSLLRLTRLLCNERSGQEFPFTSHFYSILKLIGFPIQVACQVDPGRSRPCYGPFRPTTPTTDAEDDLFPLASKCLWRRVFGRRGWNFCGRSSMFWDPKLSPDC